MSLRKIAILKRAFVAGLTVASGMAGAIEFSYFGASGPARWSELNEEWQTCANARRQSPVNIVRAAPSRTPLRMDYGLSRGEIFNNGHAIEVETERVEGENVLVLDGTRYKLKQFHLHAPSEHRIRGRGEDMELHLVHQSETGALAVIGVLLRRGVSSNTLAPVFASLPDDRNVKHALAQNFNPASLLPAATTVISAR